MAAPSECVELGFVEKCIDCVKLRSQYFPSKVGGKPAWLDLLNLPKPNELVCLNCGKPCVFLLQVYSPNNSREDCFHRTVLIFVCRETSCVSAKNNFRVFRCQLPRENEFYSSQAPDENGAAIDIAVNKAQLCVICGSSGTLLCANCKVAAYCSKAHQQFHWKAGHKVECKSGTVSDGSKVLVDSILFPEYELITECEEFSSSEDDDEDSDNDDNEMPAAQFSDDPVLRDLEAMAMSSKSIDVQFREFKKTVSHNPHQVLRYQRGGQPLWVASENKPAADDIPNCACGSKRDFEFQVMPQLLNHLGVDSVEVSLDWGTLAVYTCAADCVKDSAAHTYHEEFLWKQDFTS